MAEYIEREALGKDLKETYQKLNAIYDGLFYDEERRICGGQLTTLMEVMMRVKDWPAADVVEVVRCKDCKYHHWEQEPCHGKTERFCSVLDTQVFANFYCYHGKKKEQEGRP